MTDVCPLQRFYGPPVSLCRSIRRRADSKFRSCIVMPPRMVALRTAVASSRSFDRGLVGVQGVPAAKVSAKRNSLVREHLPHIDLERRLATKSGRVRLPIATSKSAGYHGRGLAVSWCAFQVPLRVPSLTRTFVVPVSVDANIGTPHTLDRVRRGPSDPITVSLQHTDM